MSTIRPLPARPSLEYARKEAKALLRRLRAGDPDALSRARERHPRLDTADPDRIRLADAQLVLAREHGFASWPRLVRYMGDVERQQHGHIQLHGDPSFYEGRARSVLAGHGKRSLHAGRALAAFVPRFYGLTLDEVYAAEVTEDEARLAVARSYGAPSWEVLRERIAGNARTRQDAWALDPHQRANAAMKAADLEALQRVVADHPELLHPSEHDLSTGRTLMLHAVWQEARLGAEAVRPIVEWLESQGFDRRETLGLRLSGGLRQTPEEVRELLARGADPDWVSPGGIPVLEHALLRYWNGEAVDVLAAQVKAPPRPALWIAAGLGDVEGVAAFLDARGRPTAAARRLRPDFVAVGGPGGMPPLPDADDEEILFEALFVAALNGRTEVIEYLASRGAPLNSLVWGVPLVTFAVGNLMTAAVEVLVRCGADLDLRGQQDLAGGNRNRTARELARDLPNTYANGWKNPDLLRIVELCGIDLDAIARERDAGPPREPYVIPWVNHAVSAARRDAARRGQPEVGPENLLLGLLWVGLANYFLGNRIDMERLRADLVERFGSNPDVEAPPELPLRAEVQAIVDAATAFVVERKGSEVTGFHLLHALARLERPVVEEFMARYGVDMATFDAELEKALERWG